MIPPYVKRDSNRPHSVLCRRGEAPRGDRDGSTAQATDTGPASATDIGCWRAPFL